MLQRLREILGPKEGGTQADVFDNFLREQRGAAAVPFIVWNLGGAGELVALERSALSRARDDGTYWGQPLIYVVSDRATQVLEGLRGALEHGRYVELGGFGERVVPWGGFHRDWSFESAWGRHRLLPADEAVVLATERMGPTGHVIADADWHATSALARMPFAGLTLVVFLHLDNEIAWRRVLARAGVRVDLLMSTRRGTEFGSLSPTAGERATLWDALLKVPEPSRPQAFCTDDSVFVPPIGWANGGEGPYGAPAYHVPPWARGVSRGDSSQGEGLEALRARAGRARVRGERVAAPVTVAVQLRVEQLARAEEEVAVFTAGKLGVCGSGARGAIRVELSHGSVSWGPFDPARLTVGAILEWWACVGGVLVDAIDASGCAASRLRQALLPLRSELGGATRTLDAVDAARRRLGGSREDLLASLGSRPEPLPTLLRSVSDPVAPEGAALATACAALEAAVTAACGTLRLRRAARLDSARASWAPYAAFGTACQRAGLTGAKSALLRELPATTPPQEVARRLLDGGAASSLAEGPTAAQLEQVRASAVAGLAVVCDGSSGTIHEAARRLRDGRRWRGHPDVASMPAAEVRNLAVLREDVASRALAALERARGLLDALPERVDRALREHAPALDAAMGAIAAGCAKLVPGAELSGAGGASSLTSGLTAEAYDAQRRRNDLAASLADAMRAEPGEAAPSGT